MPKGSKTGALPGARHQSLACSTLLLLLLPTHNLAAASSQTCADADGALERREYDGFTLWHSCEQKACVQFHYLAEKDVGNLKRKGSFTRDKSYAKRCQQSSAKTYPKPYDRGHLVPANHLDHLPLGIAQSNFMVNILPQHSVLNRGAWLHSEEIVECVRDEEPLHVTGGALWAPGGGELLRTHAVRVPEFFWKVIVAPASGRMIAWIMPNTGHAKRTALDGYLVSVAEVERRTGQTIALPASKAWRGKGERMKKSKPSSGKSWAIPKGCDKG